jgi:hypothetical protein
VTLTDYAAEAIPERDPGYELPDGAADDDSQAAMSPGDSALWEAMVLRRPLLAHLRTIDGTLAERNRL